MSSLIMQSVTIKPVMLNVSRLNVIMLTVVEPFNFLKRENIKLI